MCLPARLGLLWSLVGGGHQFSCCGTFVAFVPLDDPHCDIGEHAQWYDIFLIIISVSVLLVGPSRHGSGDVELFSREKARYSVVARGRVVLWELPRKNLKRLGAVAQVRVPDKC